MAVIKTRADDLTGDVGAEEHTFSVDGARYKIDLTEESFNRLIDAMKVFIEVATKVGSPRSRSGARNGQQLEVDPDSETPGGVVASGAEVIGEENVPARPTSAVVASNGATADDVRAWAASQGIEVAARGRISQKVLLAYEEANSVNPYEEAEPRDDSEDELDALLAADLEPQA